MLEILILFFILTLIPFLPGIIEIFLKKDIDPLDIKQNYSKDPGFFGKSFQKLLSKALQERARVVSKDTILINLSSPKPEFLKIYKNNVNGKFINEIVYADSQNVKTDGSIESNKELVINGNFTVLHPCNVRSLLVLGNLIVYNSLNIVRWLHVEEEFIIDSTTQSNLGINFYAKKIKIKSPCTFKRIFAKRIEIGNGVKEETFKNKEILYIKGTLKSKENIEIKAKEKYLIIDGNLISDKDILVEGEIWIKGNVFSHTRVILLKNVIVGEEEKIKSVVGKKKVILGEDIKIYGYVHTDGEGIVTNSSTLPTIIF